MEYLGKAIRANSFGLIETDKGKKFVPMCECNLGDHCYLDKEGKIVVGREPQKGNNDEITALRAKCDELGIKYANNTSKKKLEEMIALAESANNTSNDNNANNVSNANNDNNDNNPSNANNTSNEGENNENEEEQ